MPDCRPAAVGRSLLTGLLVALIPATASPAQTCQVGMVPPPTTQLVTGGPIYSLAAFDDGSGSGPQLYVGGTFTQTSPPSPTPLPGLARLNAAGAYEPVGVNGPRSVTAMTVFDDGGGPALWAAGAGGVVSKWNGAAWIAGPTLPLAAFVTVLKALDLGDGPHLYAGLRATPMVWRLDLSGWTPLGGSTISGSQIQGLEAFDPDGPGPLPRRLFAAGSFSGLNGISGAAQFIGDAWAPVPGAPAFGWTKALLAFDDGSGLRLHWTSHQAPPFPSLTAVARWDGQTWDYPQSVNPANPGYALAAIDFGPGVGPRLVSASYAGLLLSSPTGPWQIIPGSTAAPSVATIYLGTLAAYRLPSGVPVVVGVTEYANSLQRVAGCPRCPGDYDLNGSADLNDLFAFLDDWFARRAWANTAAPSVITVEDLFVFLQRWFAGC